MRADNGCFARSDVDYICGSRIECSLLDNMIQIRRSKGFRLTKPAVYPRLAFLFVFQLNLLVVFCYFLSFFVVFRLSFRFFLFLVFLLFRFLVSSIFVLARILCFLIFLVFVVFDTVFNFRSLFALPPCLPPGAFFPMISL